MSPAALKRVLYICTTFPPRVGGSLGRNLGFVRHLPAYGWQPTVLTVGSQDRIWDDATPLATLAPELEVIRAWAPTYPSAHASTAGEVPRGKGIRARLRDFALTWVLVPDREAPWVPFAVRAGLEAMKRQRYEAMISSGPPHSAHLVARALLMFRRVRWVADCTDPWAEHPYAYYAHPLRHRLDRWMEVAVLREADAIVVPTTPLVESFRTRLGSEGRLFATIPNVYEESDFAGIAPLPHRGLHIVHVGSFYGPRSPAAFLTALRRIVAEPGSRPELVVTLAGYADDPSHGCIKAAQHELGGILVYEPFLPRRDALQLMVSADILLLVTDAGSGGRDLVPLKTFEYLRAGRTILALVPEGEVKQILRRTGGAVFAPPDDPDAIAAALRNLILDRERRRLPNSEQVRRFDVHHLAGELASLLTDA